jgi:hypothetical protein
MRQLVPYIDQNFNTVRERWGCAVTGYSMGGGGMRYAARYPELFGIASAFSAAIDLTQPDVGIRADPRADALEGQVFGRWEDHEIQWRGVSVPDIAKNLANTNLTITHGDRNPPESTYILQGAIATRARLEGLGIGFNYNVFPGNNHGQGQIPSLNYWLPILKTYLANPNNRTIPTAFSYSSIEPSYQTYGWSVVMQRAATEFSAIEVADSRNFLVIGSGFATVRSPPIAGPNIRFLTTISNLSNPKLSTSMMVRSDPDGRLTIPVQLGPANPFQQFSDQANSASNGPSPDAALVPFRTSPNNGSRFHRARVTISPAPIEGASGGAGERGK